MQIHNPTTMTPDLKGRISEIEIHVLRFEFISSIIQLKKTEHNSMK